MHEFAKIDATTAAIQLHVAELWLEKPWILELITLSNY